jgi:hypothetical protein
MVTASGCPMIFDSARFERASHYLTAQRLPLASQGSEQASHFAPDLAHGQASGITPPDISGFRRVDHFISTMLFPEVSAFRIRNLNRRKAGLFLDLLESFLVRVGDRRVAEEQGREQRSGDHLLMMHAATVARSQPPWPDRIISIP